MRKFLILPAFFVASMLSDTQFANAAGGDCGAAPACGCNACGPCDPCDPCNGHGGLFGHHHRHRRGDRYEGLGAGFNCGCNGSYKFPVPPLYTYHWPGMWQQPLMTDYHSPWRFPPLKPYVDEPVADAMGIDSSTPSRVRPASATRPSHGSVGRSFSSQLELISR